LIDRSKRPLQLTRAGGIYHHGCRQILDQYERLTRRLSGAGDPIRGRVRIAAIYSAGIDLLNQLADGFRAAYPHTVIEVDYDHPAQVLQQVRDDLADLGIVSYPQRWRDLTVFPLREETMVVVCPPHHALADRQTVGPADLAGRAMVGFDPELPISRRIHSFFRRHRTQAQVAHTFDNIDTIKAYLAHSDEVAILPERTVRREAAAGALKVVGLQPTLTRPLAIMHHRQRPLTPAINSFVEHMLKYGSAQATAPADDQTTAAKRPGALAVSG
ncbi:MAG: LysR family transcriptional regulator, partial [Planctomycetes bacterium]|nr:LysR family transcriptional regulator [Planctomycetota bacterium]